MDLENHIAGRYLDKVYFDPISGCWIWCGAKTGDGCGHIIKQGKDLRAHRYFYEAFNGPIPQNLLLSKRCNLIACVNPNHYIPLSNQEIQLEAAINKWSELSVEIRFWIKVQKTSTCWLWMGAKSSKGYGNFKLPDRWISAHVYAYQLLVGHVPSYLELDHLCRVRHCVNPDHLEPVLQVVNILRGIAPSALNAVKTHCKNGHEFSGYNLIISKKGHRACRICKNATWLYNHYKNKEIN